VEAFHNDDFVHCALDFLFVAPAVLPVDAGGSDIALLNDGAGAGSFTLSFEADLQGGRLFVWLNGRLLGTVFEGIDDIGDMRPAVAIDQHGTVVGPAHGQCFELIPSPCETE
jgi:hypothetical protein